MRLALVTDGIWPYVLGGMQKHSYYLCKYLAKQQVHIDLFHFNQSNYDIQKLEFFTEDERKFIRSFVVQFPHSKHFPGHYLYNSYKYSKKIFDCIKPHLELYDFIYTKGFSGWYLINQKYQGNISCAKIGLKFHGYEMFQTAPDMKIKLQHLLLLRNPVIQLSKRADLVFSYGGKITNIITSIGVKAERIYELPSGVESSFIVEKIKPSKEHLKFLFLGRYERRKGLEELNEAIVMLQQEQPHWQAEFHFIGPIPEDKKIKGKGIYYHGEIRDKTTLQSLIKNCDLLLCPSWSEGMPNVILEAMASGLAVIATDVGATNVLVNAKTGWLLKESNSLEIKNTLLGIRQLSAASIDEKKREALRCITNEFTWEKLIEKFCTDILKHTN